MHNQKVQGVGNDRRHRDDYLESAGTLYRRSLAPLRQPHPNKTAVICGDVSWTFAEMDAICNRLGRGLLGLGVGKGDRVAVLSRNSHAFAAVRFAVARIGAMLVPINFMLNPDEINFILANSGAKLLAIGPDFVERGARRSGQGLRRRKIGLAAGRGSGDGAGGHHHLRRSAARRRLSARSLGRQPRSRADHLHQRHGIAAEGRHAHP